MKVSSFTVNARRGFTLIELLVVVAILALLVSILLPSLTRARELAGDAVCLSNMHHLTLAMLMYADSYNGYFFNTPCPGHRRGIPGDLVWQDAGGQNREWTDWGLLFQSQHLDDGQIGYCPRDTRLSYEEQWGSFDDPSASHNTSYYSRNWFDEGQGFWGVTIHNIEGRSSGAGPGIDPAENARLPRRSLIADAVQTFAPETWGMHDGYQMAGYTDGSAQPIELSVTDVQVHMGAYSRLGRLFPAFLDARQ